jgi:GGDEF domain-containing protein
MGIRRMYGQLSAGVDKVKIRMDASIGVAQWQPGETAHQVIEHADAAMYKEKNFREAKPLATLDHPKCSMSPAPEKVPAVWQHSGRGQRIAWPFLQASHPGSPISLPEKIDFEDD